GLSMGADRGVLISDAELAGADALLTARALAAAIKAEEPDLVICATESYDGSTGMVPPMLAELLGFPQLTFAKKVEANGSSVKVHRQTADGYQVVEAPMPALITVTAAIAEPRYASLKGIMAARSKEIKQLSVGDLGEVYAIALGAVANAVAATLGKHGAKAVHVNEDAAFDDYVAEPATDALAALYDKEKPDLILFGFTSDSREVAGRLAARLGSGLISHASDGVAKGCGFGARVP